MKLIAKTKPYSKYNRMPLEDHPYQPLVQIETYRISAQERAFLDANVECHDKILKYLGLPNDEILEVPTHNPTIGYYTYIKHNWNSVIVSKTIIFNI